MGDITPVERTYGVEGGAHMLAGQVLSVNVGRPRHVTWNGKTVVTAIWKLPVTDRRSVSLTNVDGDRQADLRVHGGRDKAVYAYSAADLAWWEEALGRPLTPGTFGENLTVTTSWDLGGSLIGDLWRIGSAEFEVTWSHGEIPHSLPSHPAHNVNHLHGRLLDARETPVATLSLLDWETFLRPLFEPAGH